jgi:hypothetical protein
MPSAADHWNALCGVGEEFFNLKKILNEKRQYAQLKFSIISEKLPSRPLTPSQLCCGFRPALDCIFLNLLYLVHLFLIYSRKKAMSEKNKS